MSLKIGDKFPDGVKFDYAPITDSDPKSINRPEEYDASAGFKGKKVVLVSVPGAFTPGCDGRHLPPFVQNINKIADKGVDLVVFIAYNDAFVMAAWAKVNGVGEDSKIKFMSDSKTFLSKQIGWMAGMGERNGRWAMIIEKDGTISYAEHEKSPRDVELSSAETVLAKL